VVLGAGCSHPDPESFCQSWVGSTCDAIADCCTGGAKFDPNDCRLQLSSTCQAMTQATRVQAGEVKWDSSAASACFPVVGACSDLASDDIQQPSTYAQSQACANMVVGFQPLGSACTGSGQCEKQGDYSTCWGGGGNTSGVCAKTVLDESTCSFSFSTLELHVCPDGMFCDRTSSGPKPGQLPSESEFEFSASCKSPLAAGRACDPFGNGVPCATGLFCETSPTNPGSTGTCTAERKAGQTCKPGDVCVQGLQCLPGGAGNTFTCQGSAQGSLFCFTSQPVPGGGTVCGDGVCEPGENPVNCPQDC
jgi:hypothetical protein